MKFIYVEFLAKLEKFGGLSSKKSGLADKRTSGQADKFKINYLISLTSSPIL
jgi:hypothetical protein